MKKIEDVNIPLTSRRRLLTQWLEAAVFFVCSASVDLENRDKWNRLAKDRLDSYDRISKVGVDGFIDEYRKTQ